jgi:hypothetical protein
MSEFKYSRRELIMSRLGKSDLEERLRLDYRVATSMQYDLMKLSAHKTKKTAMQEQNPIRDEYEAGEAWFYSVRYYIPTLKGPNQLMKQTHFLVDLNHGGNYPFTMPDTRPLGDALPWSPHFLRGHSVCLSLPGALWSTDGSTLLGHVLIQVAKLLNYDEPDCGEHYSGWNDAAVKYWRRDMKCKPLDPNIRYPVLPDWLFSGVNQPSLYQPQVKTVNVRIISTSNPTTQSIKIISQRR